MDFDIKDMSTNNKTDQLSTKEYVSSLDVPLEPQAARYIVREDGTVEFIK